MDIRYSKFLEFKEFILIFYLFFKRDVRHNILILFFNVNGLEFFLDDVSNLFKKMNSITLSPIRRTKPKSRFQN